MNSSKIIILLLIREGKDIADISSVCKNWYNYYAELILNDLIIQVKDSNIYYELTRKGVDLTNQILQAYRDFT